MSEHVTNAHEHSHAGHESHGADHGAGHDGHAETSHAHAATEKSNSWLSGAFSKLKRWTGHGALTLGGEFFTNLGMLTTPVGVGLALATANPIFLTMAAPTLIGSTIGWQGAKKAGSGEKGAYIGIKALAPASILIGPTTASIMSTLSFASTALAMRHRA